MRRRILELAWPAVLGNMLQTIVSIVDLIMVGGLGAGAVAAVGLGGQMLWFSNALMVAVAVGTTALVARSVGAREKGEADHILIQSLIIVGLLSTVLTAFWYASAESVLRLIGADEEVAKLGGSYIRMVFLSTPSMFLVLVAEGALRGAGDTKTPMWVGVIMNGMNVVLNYILIFGKLGFPAMGVIGAGIATGISFVWASLAYIVIFFSGRFVLKISREDDFSLKRETIKRILNIGIPTGVQRIVMSGSMIFYVSIIAGFGTIALAAHQIGLRVESLSYMPGFGFAVAATTLVGQNLGAKDTKKAEESGWESAKLCALFMGIVGVFMIVFARQMALLFVSDPEVVGLAAWYLRIVAVSEPPLAVVFTLIGGLQGAGDTRYPLYISGFGLWLLRIPLAYVLGITLGWGVLGAWIAMTIDTFVRGGLYAYWFKKGKWKEIKV